ncbi:TetR family transcriptional regulator [Nocardioides gansuensis]|uniref:TetR family transcriptional regulator n=1 Tax=Nocardioides gansuensis TaxID=2138300 RepID=A0A2T8F4F7_9ACTN|nr:TetR family transcriptional regulator [Nocardioides gansuensis]PVG80596.1 TetR family transcriptional regulator [Nocardioides gansuensis]
MTRPRSHYPRGETRKALVLDAAVEVIAEHGLEGVTHRAIAKAAGVPLSTTSYFFASLDDLIGAAVTRIAESILEAVESLVADAATLTQGNKPVEEYVDRLLDVVTAPRERQILVQFEAYLGTTRRPELAEPVRRIVEAYEHAAATAFSALGAPEPDKAARHLVAVLDGFALQRIAHPRPDDAMLLREAIRTVANAHLGARS